MKISDRTLEPGRGAGARQTSSPPRAHGRQHRNPRLRGAAQALVLAVIVSGLLTGCAFYTFSGASIPSHLNTIAIPIADDNTSNPVPNLGRDLTNRLTDQFVGRTRYSLDNSESDADAVLTARIQRYTNQPTGVSGEERATTNQVEIRVQARYYDQVRDSTMVEQTFTGAAEYDPTREEEQAAAQVAVENVTESIFTTTTSDW